MYKGYENSLHLKVARETANYLTRYERSKAGGKALPPDERPIFVQRAKRPYSLKNVSQPGPFRSDANQNANWRNFLRKAAMGVAEGLIILVACLIVADMVYAHV